MGWSWMVGLSLDHVLMQLPPCSSECVIWYNWHLCHVYRALLYDTMKNRQQKKYAYDDRLDEQIGYRMSFIKECYIAIYRPHYTYLPWVLVFANIFHRFCTKMWFWHHSKTKSSRSKLSIVFCYTTTSTIESSKTDLYRLVPNISSITPVYLLQSERCVCFVFVSHSYTTMIKH